MRKSVLHTLLIVMMLAGAGLSRADVVATYSAATDVPVTASSFTASGQAFSATLNFAPPTGTTLMVVKNTGLAFINGTFSNLAHGQPVTLSYGGINYRFVANYYGGTGNDLVLQWTPVRMAAWGDNHAGQLGDHTRTGRFVPIGLPATGVLTGKTVTATAAGRDHSLALCSDGTVAAWGLNNFGQLGDNGANYSSPVPVAVYAGGVLAGKTVVGIAAGWNFSLAVCSDGTVAAWGWNMHGQLGNNSMADSLVPVAVTMEGALAGKSVVKVAAGSSHSLALCSDGTVVAWGDNDPFDGTGKLGNDSTVSSSIAVAVNTSGVLSGKTVVAISAGSSHSLALCSDGTVVGWGANYYGRLGNSTTSHSRVPVAVTTSGVLAGKTVSSISAGGIHSLALCTDGTLAAWGDNTYGELGNNSTVSSSAPVAVFTGGLLAGRTVTDVAAGAAHSLAFCADGTIAAWGDNADFDDFGRLGNGGTAESPVPVAVDRALLREGERFVMSSTNSLASHSFSFIASPSPPIVANSAASDLSFTTATLHAVVNPNGNVTTAQFEFGPTESYGNSAGVTLAPNDGSSPMNVSVTLNGLTPGSVYHYRLKATNAMGVAQTVDSKFATSSNVVATYTSPTDVPIITESFSAAGASFSATLDFSPSVATNLTVVENTGADFIYGTFTNLSHGQLVMLSYGGINYPFVADFYGGTGNDLVLHWARTRPVAWGSNSSGQIGNGSGVNQDEPVDVLNSGILDGKTVLRTSAGESHSLALLSDGTAASWGQNFSGTLGTGNGASSSVPLAVKHDGILAGRTIIGLSGGTYHSLVVCSDGKVFAFGHNSSGQLGNNGQSSSYLPVSVDDTGVLAGKTVVSVVAASSHSLALCSDGTVAAWGSNYNGELGNDSNIGSSVPVAVRASDALAGRAVVAIAAGWGHSLALCSDGKIVGWGNNSSGQLGIGSRVSSLVPINVQSTGALAGKTVTRIAAGSAHSLALCSDGTLVAWGENQYGQLGNNSTDDQLVPSAVDISGALAGKTVVAISAGLMHSVVRCSDGSVVLWGRNNASQLGGIAPSGTLAPILFDRALASGEEDLLVESGSESEHNLGVRGASPTPVVKSLPLTNLAPTSVSLNGSINPCGNLTTAAFEFGLNDNYGSSVNVVLSQPSSLSPQNVSADLTGLLPDTTYHYRLTATNAAGTVSATDGTFTTSINLAATFDSDSDVGISASKISVVGGTFSASLNFIPTTGANLVAISNLGRDFIEGRFANLAQGQVVTLNYGGIDYRFVANYYGGTGNDLILHWANIRPVAWGVNGSGQIGDNSITTQRVPVDVVTTGVLAGKTVISASIGAAHSLALCSDGTVAAWGNNNFGQLGNGTGSGRRTPGGIFTTGFLAGKSVIAVAAGENHSLALCSDGKVAAWGDNGYGQLGNNSTTDSTVPLAVSTAGVLAGKVVVAIATGKTHSLALCSDGTVAAWGDNFYGQLGNVPPQSPYASVIPIPVSSAGALSGKTVVSIAAGSEHSLALCSDGTLAAWGRNGSGRLGDGSTTSRTIPVAVKVDGVLSNKSVTELAGGDSHTLALCSDGTIVAWGQNTYGQLGNNSTAQSLVPVAVDGSGVILGKTVVGVRSGAFHSLAYCSDGTVVAWGRNASGQLGNNSITQSSVPVLVSSSSFAAGERYSGAFSGEMASHNVGLIASPPAPAVSTLAATGFTPDGATLRGMVNAATGSAIVSFDYGLDASYGANVAANPTPVIGDTESAVSAPVTVLSPNTTYHYRVRATNAGGTTLGADMTFMTGVNVDGPTAGTMNVAPDLRVDPGVGLTVGFDGWVDANAPMTYALLIDDVVVSGNGEALSRSVAAPMTSGGHTLKGRVYDGLGNFTDIFQTLTVNSAQEIWRRIQFGTTQNEGAAADTADPDSDGNNNLFEFVAGLDPKDSLSSFTVRIDMVEGQPGYRAISFGPIVSGRTYRVRTKLHLGDPTWVSLTNSATTTTGTQRTVTDRAAGDGPRFYRVEVTLP